MENSINEYDEYVMYPGRFQPPHNGHISIFEESLKRGKKICIAIRNVNPDEKNPLYAATVKMLWEKVYADNPMVKVIIIPNISAIKYGRTVGYSIEEIIVPPNIAGISATEIRNSIKQGSDSWKENVSPLIWEDLKELLAEY